MFTRINTMVLCITIFVAFGTACNKQQDPVKIADANKAAGERETQRVELEAKRDASEKDTIAAGKKPTDDRDRVFPPLEKKPAPMGTGNLIVPLHLPKLGKWLVKGVDIAGNTWEAWLVFAENIDDLKNAGYFDWKSNVGSGREHFFGTYDPKTRRICWTGHRFEDKVGALTFGTYEAELSNDKTRLRNGNWVGGIPGTWTAEWTE